jgi:hypothetical protein
MPEPNIIREGSRFIALVNMKLLCNIIMERADANYSHQFKHPELVSIPEGEIFTVDAVLDQEVFCDFDEHDHLCEKFVPAHIRHNSGTMTFITCEFVATRTDIIKLCEHIGFEKHPPDYPGPIIM